MNPFLNEDEFFKSTILLDCGLLLKAGPHKYLRKEGYGDNVKYYYRLPSGIRVRKNKEKWRPEEWVNDEMEAIDEKIKDIEDQIDKLHEKETKKFNELKQAAKELQKQYDAHHPMISDEFRKEFEEVYKDIGVINAIHRIEKGIDEFFESFEDVDDDNVDILEKLSQQYLHLKKGEINKLLDEQKEIQKKLRVGRVFMENDKVLKFFKIPMEELVRLEKRDDEIINILYGKEKKHLQGENK